MLAILDDFEEASNRQDQNTLKNLVDIRMILRYKGCTLKEDPLLGDGPNGTKLGLYLLLILINSSCFQYREICIILGETVTNPKKNQLKRLNKSLFMT